MENNLSLQKETLNIDSHELLLRFILKCKKESENNENKDLLTSAADLVTAVYYYRKYPDADNFISQYLSNSQDYFQIQWVRRTWANLSKLTPDEHSNLVINQISLVANSEEEQ